jgi:hypothetical protein
VGAKQRGAELLTFGLRFDEAHLGTLSCNNDVLDIGHMVLMPFDERLDIDWRDQTHVMPQPLKFPTPARRRRTSLHGDHAFGLLCYECEQLTP